MAFQKSGKQYSNIKQKQIVIKNVIIPTNLDILVEIVTYLINNSNINLITKD